MSHSHPSRKTEVAIAIALWCLLALPMARAALEAQMITHMAVQIPLLALAGARLARGLRPFEPRWLERADWRGLCGLTLVLFTMAYWMLPRSLDSALADPRVELLKFVSVPLLLGMPLGSSWRRLPALARFFAIANFISMLGTMGGLYLTAPTRLCVFYVLDQQLLAGKTLIAAAVGLTLFFFLAAFFGLMRPAAVRRESTEMAEAG